MSETSQFILPISCPRCDLMGHATFAQTAIGKHLRWYRSVSCPTRGHVEEDGDGPGPPELRAALLERGGLWSIRIEGPQKVRAMQIVRRVMGRSLAESKAFLRSYPNIMVGTNAEAQWLVARMVAEGLNAELGTVRFDLKAPLQNELPDETAAHNLLTLHHIDISEVVDVIHHHDGSMSITLNRADNLWHMGIEFDPDLTKSLAAAFIAVGVPVQINND